MDAYGFSGVVTEVCHRNPQHSNVILDGTNYIPWKLTIKGILDSIHVPRHVDGIFTTLTQSNITVAFSEASAFLAAFEQQLEKWIVDDSMTKMIIC